MERNTENSGGWRGSRWRIVLWAAAASILLLPLVAMQFTAEVKWSVVDFAFAGVLLAGAGIAYELAVRARGDTAYRAAVAVALAAAFILVWVSLSVGIIGKDGDPANLLYLGVLAVGVTGSVIARFRPAGMARALLATALAQVLVGVIALAGRLGHPWSGPLEILGLTAFFVALFAASALLFRKAARGEPERGAA